MDKKDKRENFENYIVQENRQFLYSLKKRLKRTKRKLKTCERDFSEYNIVVIRRIQA